MIFLQFAAHFVIDAGYVTIIVLPLIVIAVLGVACVRAIVIRVNSKSR